jgi:putative Ca2+/H+ antiporter (TMEM165/GDT1 family)
MTGWFEILLTAFFLQISVLPGEKVQFIIAGLSTRYSPWVVVAAAGSAFAGWTALEIIFGSLLQQILAPVVLDAITAVLFLLFAVLLIRSAPEPGETLTVSDGGIPETKRSELSAFGYQLPSFNGFVPIFTLMAAGEFGDKTQLVTFSLAIQYGAHPAIWAGEMLAIIPVSIANALFFHRFSNRFNPRLAHFAGAALFLFFGLDAVLLILTGFSVWETVIDTIVALVMTLA